MKKKQSLRNKATNFVSVLLNPISDPPDSHKHPPPSSQEDVGELKKSDEEGNNHDVVDGPDTSSFTAFLYSLWSSSDSKENANSNGKNDDKGELDNDNSSSSNSSLPDSSIKENGGRKSLFSRSKQSVGGAIRRVVRIGRFHHQGRKDNSNNVVEMKLQDKRKESVPVKEKSSSVALDDMPGISEPSVLVSKSIRNVLYASLPPLMHGRKWLLLYSTWRNGISLSTLYRRSMLWPGLSLLVVGDKKGAVFGSLVETPLKPSSKRKYQGTNSTYVFSNISGRPIIYHPTGVNRYFTLCNTDYIAIGGGGHFALYLDGDLLNGSSSVSETFGNPCLANSQDFEVKEVELWGFVHTSSYDEVLALSRTEAPGISRW